MPPNKKNLGTNPGVCLLQIIFIIVPTLKALEPSLLNNFDVN